MAAPMKPASSPITVKMKSLSLTGTKLPWVCGPWKSPRPHSPPPPMAMRACVALYAAVLAASSGLTKEVRRAIW